MPCRLLVIVALSDRFPMATVTHTSPSNAPGALHPLVYISCIGSMLNCGMVLICINICISHICPHVTKFKDATKREEFEFEFNWGL